MSPSYQTIIPPANAPKEERSSTPVPMMKKVGIAAMVGTALVAGYSYGSSTNNPAMIDIATTPKNTWNTKNRQCHRIGNNEQACKELGGCYWFPSYEAKRTKPGLCSVYNPAMIDIATAATPCIGMTEQACKELGIRANPMYRECHYIGNGWACEELEGCYWIGILPDLTHGFCSNLHPVNCGAHHAINCQHCTQTAGYGKEYCNGECWWGTQKKGNWGEWWTPQCWPGLN